MLANPQVSGLRGWSVIPIQNAECRTFWPIRESRVSAGATLGRPPVYLARHGDTSRRAAGSALIRLISVRAWLLRRPCMPLNTCVGTG